MKRTSFRLAVPLLSCTLLLTACPGTKPTTIDVPSNPAVLDGIWEGELATDVLLRPEAAGEDRLYLLRDETRLASSPGRDTRLLVVLDAATGTELQSLPLEGAQAVRLRPAGDGAPARLLVLHGASVSPARPTALSEHDPVTLKELRRVPLPDWSGSVFLSDDGRWLLSGTDVPVDTRTGQLASLPAAVLEQLARSQDPVTRRVGWRSEGDFLYVERYPSQPNETYSIVFFSAVTGQAFGGLAQHPAACTVTPSDLTTPTDLVDLPDGGAALAYPDGTVELRDAQDRLRQVVRPGGCAPYHLRIDGDVLTFAGGFSRTLGTLRVSDGKLLSQRNSGTGPGQASPWLVGAGTVLWVRNPQAPGALLTLERASGELWNLPPQLHRLRLDTRATWQSKTQYTSLGTGMLDGERLNFSAVATAQGYELRPQTSPPVRRVVWKGELRREDGHLVARLEGTHGDQAASHWVKINLQDMDRDFAFVGELRR